MLKVTDLLYVIRGSNYTELVTTRETANKRRDKRGTDGRTDREHTRFVKTHTNR